MKRNSLILCLLTSISLLVLSPVCYAKGIHLKTTDVVELREDIGAAWGQPLQAVLKREVELSADASVISTPSITFVDYLPSTQKLICPKGNTCWLKTADGRKFPVSIASKVEGKKTKVSFKAYGLPTDKTYAAKPFVGRFSYDTGLVGDPYRWTSSNFTTKPLVIPCGKAKAKATLRFSRVAVHDAVLEVNMPFTIEDTTGGRDIPVKLDKYDPRFKVKSRSSKRIILSAPLKKPKDEFSLNLQLEAHPKNSTRSGDFTLGYATVKGTLKQPVRPAPKVTNYAGEVSHVQNTKALLVFEMLVHMTGSFRLFR